MNAASSNISAWSRVKSPSRDGKLVQQEPVDRAAVHAERGNTQHHSGDRHVCSQNTLGEPATTVAQNSQHGAECPQMEQEHAGERRGLRGGRRDLVTVEGTTACPRAKTKAPVCTLTLKNSPGCAADALEEAGESTVTLEEPGSRWLCHGSSSL